MSGNNVFWNIRKDFITLSDINYKSFTVRLNPSKQKINIFGVSIPKLRNYFHSISLDDQREYYSYIINHMESNDVYLEEKILLGIIIGLCKSNIDDTFIQIQNYLKIINTWSICDIFVSNMKITKKQKLKIYNFIQQFKASKKEYEIRFYVVMILSYFLKNIDEQQLNSLFLSFEELHAKDYYAYVSISWALSKCYKLYPFQTMSYFENSKLDEKIISIAKQKIKNNNKKNI